MYKNNIFHFTYVYFRNIKRDVSLTVMIFLISNYFLSISSKHTYIHIMYLYTLLYVVIIQFAGVIVRARSSKRASRTRIKSTEDIGFGRK